MKIRNIRTALIMLILFFVSVSTAGVDLTDAEITPNQFWLGKDSSMGISSKCTLDRVFTSVLTVMADIYDPDSKLVMSPKLGYDEVTRTYIYSFKPSFSKTGRYKVNVKCSYGDSESNITKEFFVHKLELKIVKEGRVLEGYMGKELTLYVDFRRDNELVSPSQDTFRVYIGKFRGSNKFDEELTQLTSPVISGYHQKINIAVPLRSDDISEGIYDIKVIGYSDGVDTKTEEYEFVNLNAPLKIDITQDIVKCFTSSICKKDIPVRVIFSAGSIMDLTIENIEAVIIDKGGKGRSIYIGSLNCNEDSETCTVSLDIPSTLNPGSYTLFLTFAYPDTSNYQYISKDSVPLEVVLQLKGGITDASGNIVDTTLILENNDTGQSISRRTDTSGGYSLDILPGRYDLTAIFNGGVTAKFSDVSISESDVTTVSENLIRYDQNHLNSGGPGGVRIVKIVVLEFALPFSGGWLYIPYDSLKVNGDENDLMVYKCGKWNFKKSTCTGEWGEITPRIHTIRDTLEFNIESSGAFVIGERRGLIISTLEAKSESVYMGDPVILVGKVIDSDGNPMDGVVIESSFPRFNLSKTTTSGAGGLFTAEINAPYAEGPVDLMIKAGNTPFIPYNLTKTINVLRKKDIAIVGIPDTVDINLNEERLINFKIFNSGQTNFTDPISIYVSGISRDWYELLPAKINSLGVNEYKDVNLKVRLTPELCGGKCSKYILVNIEVKSGQISKAMSFTLTVISPENLTKGTAGDLKQNENSRNIGIGDVMGFATAIPVPSIPSIDTNLIFISIIIILVLLTVIKKKGKRQKKRGKHAIRSRVVGSLHRVKSGI